MSEPSDDLGDRLRRALRSEAEDVSPAEDGLERIRARVADGRGRRLTWLSLLTLPSAGRWKPTVAVGAAAAALAAAALIVAPAALHVSSVGHYLPFLPVQTSRSASDVPPRTTPPPPSETHATRTADSTAPQATRPGLVPPPVGQTCDGTRDELSGAPETSTEEPATPTPSAEPSCSPTTSPSPSPTTPTTLPTPTPSPTTSESPAGTEPTPSPTAPECDEPDCQPASPTSPP